MDQDSRIGLTNVRGIEKCRYSNCSFVIYIISHQAKPLVDRQFELPDAHGRVCSAVLKDVVGHVLLVNPGMKSYATFQDDTNADTL